MVIILAGTNGADGAGSPWSVLLMYAIIIGGLFYFLMIRPQRTRMRRQEQLVASIGVGDEIQTIGGIYGRIEFIDADTAVIQVEGGGRLKIAKRAIAGKVNP
jgi:preprotein translocase subunit YajC